MMRLKSHNPLRDLLLGALLLLFIRSALHLEADRQKNRQLEHDEPFMVHEPAQEVIDTFATAKQQLEQTVTLALQKNKPEIIAHLEDLKSTVTTIESRYSKNSPALLFLGPFASVSIVLKEREIEQQLAGILNELNEALHNLLEQKPETKYGVENMDTCLKKNQQLLAQFAVSNPKNITA